VGVLWNADGCGDFDIVCVWGDGADVSRMICQTRYLLWGREGGVRA
jgi:hypothetical protein